MSGLGTRAGVEAAEMQRGQSQLLADIEAKGLQSAFQNAQQQFAQQKAREQQMAGNIGRTGPALFQAGLAERGAQMGVGEQKREAAQSELDEAYFKFLEERGFPQQTLADYSQTVYGSPLSKQPFPTTTSTTGTPFVSSPASQLMGLGLGGLNIYGMGGGFTPNPTGFGLGNFFQGSRGAKEGGQINSRGLSGLPVIRRQAGSGIGGRTFMTVDRFGNRINSDLGTAQSTPTSYQGIIRNILGTLTGGGTYSDPNTIRDTIAADVDRTGYFDPVKRAIPSRIKMEELKNAALLAKEGRQNIRRNTLEEARKARGEHYPELEKQAGLINVGREVGKHLQEPVPPGTTPVEQFTQFLGAVSESAGRQIEEGFKEKAELKKEQYTEEQSERATEAAQLLKDSELEHATSIELIKGEFNLKELLAKLPIEKQQQINSDINTKLKIENLGLAKINTAAALLKVLGDLNKTKGGDKGGKAYVSNLKQLINGVSQKYKVLLTYDGEGNVIGMKRADGTPISNTDLDFIRATREIYAKTKNFLNMLTTEGAVLTQKEIAKAQNNSTSLIVSDPPDEEFKAFILNVAPIQTSHPIAYRKALQVFANKYYNGDTIAAQAHADHWKEMPHAKRVLKNP